MNVIFWGSNELSLPFLKHLCNNNFVKLNSVITIPDKPQDRGLKLKPSLVKIFAKENSIKCLTPDRLDDKEFFRTLEGMSPDVSFVVSYGKIIPQNIIQLHKIGMLNIHFSLLPKYRGAAPIQWALLNGEKETGVTIFWIDKNLDTGDIFLQEKVSVSIDDDYYILSKKLIDLGLKLLDCAINNLINNNILRVKQQGTPTYCYLIKKEHGRINWNDTAEKIHNKVRAFVHWPKAYTQLQIFSLNKVINVKILKTQIFNNEEFKLKLNEQVQYGNIVKIYKDFLLVYCGEQTYLKILKIQPENRKELNIKDFVCGYRIKEFDRFI